jgi:hypothetical protein
MFPENAGQKPGGKAEAMPHNAAERQPITGDKIAGATDSSRRAKSSGQRAVA